MEHSLRLAVVASVGTALLVGCWAHNRIPPMELPRLNGASVTSVGPGSRFVALTVHNVRRVDGTLLQVQGEFNAEVVPRNRDLGAISFSHPVEAHVDDETVLRVSGGNRPETNFRLRDVDYIDIATIDVLLSALFGAGLGALVGGVAAGIVLAIFL